MGGPTTSVTCHLLERSKTRGPKKQELVSTKTPIEVVEGMQRRCGRSRRGGGGLGVTGGWRSSWCSLLGAGTVFGSAHCIISVSPNLRRANEQPARGGNAALLRGCAAPAARRTAGRRRRSRITPHPHPPINRTGRCLSLGAIMSPGQSLALLRIQVYPPLCWLA